MSDFNLFVIFRSLILPPSVTPKNTLPPEELTKATKSGKIVGYAMETPDFSESNQDEILVFVNVGYYVAVSEYSRLSEMIEFQQREIKRLRIEIEKIKKE